MKKLSIITINYNDAPGLDKTIQSVLSQTFKNFQYIVIDGGSNDGSKDVLNRYNDDLDIAISEPDKGIYNAMNKGAGYATGEYLLFLNSGDTLYDNTCLKQLFSLPLNEDIVSSRLYTYSANSAALQIPPENISLYTFTGGSLPHPSTIIKRSIFQKVGGYIESYKIMSDWCFFIDALLIHKCTYRTTPIIVAKFNCFGISSNNNGLELYETEVFLKDKFGRILNDYLPIQEESLMNCMYWIHRKTGFIKKLLIFPYKVMNRILRLRNKLSIRVGSMKIS